MPTASFDFVDGASLDIDANTARFVRMGKVRDIDLSSTPDAEALVKVMAVPGVPQIGHALSSNYPYLTVKRIRIAPIDVRNPNDVGLSIEYRYDRDSFTPTVFIVRDDSYANQSVTPRIPGTSNTMSIGFTPTGESDESEDIRPDVVVMNLFKPVRSIGITALRYGRPTGGFQDKMCYVNDADWPNGSVAMPNYLQGQASGNNYYDSAFGPDVFGTTQPSATSLPKGYWLLSRYLTEYNQYRGYFTLQAQAITRVVEDWSEILVLRNAQGKAPYGGIGRAAQTAIETSIEAQDYRHGQIWPTNDSVDNMNGIARVGPYPTTNFESLFGF